MTPVTEGFVCISGFRGVRALWANSSRCVRLEVVKGQQEGSSALRQRTYRLQSTHSEHHVVKGITSSEGFGVGLPCSSLMRKRH